MGTPPGRTRGRPRYRPSETGGSGVGWPCRLECSSRHDGFGAEENVSWLETYRGMVYRWEVDHNDHLTVVYYFARIADAGLGLLEPRGLEGFPQTARDTVQPGELDVFGQSALSHYIHRFSAANGHAIAAFGMTPGYQRDQRRGFSTFEFQLAIGGTLRPGDSVRVQSALLHVGNSSMRLLHVMTDERSAAPVATLEQLGVPLDMDARKSTPLPDELRARAKAVLVATGA